MTLTCAFALATTTAPTFTACQSGTFTTSGARADGNYRFTVRATDPAGNVGTASALLTIDTVAPAAPAITSRPAGLQLGEEPVLRVLLHGRRGLLRVLPKPRGGAALCASGQTYGPLGDGDYVQSDCRDVAGMMSVR